MSVQTGRRRPSPGSDARCFDYSRDPPEAFKSVARLLKKILNGAAPGDLPIEQPTKFNLFINLKTAKTLDIEISQALIARADKVFE